MKKVELLAPAGNLQKLKMAYLYGADAVYVGGKSFSLRARASNFTLDDIKEAAEFALSLGKKLYITMNVVPHNVDLIELEEYLKFLESVNVTGIIVSSLYIASVAKEVAPKLERHLSTQDSVTNSNAIKYYENKGFSRVVLGRETTLKEMAEIRKNTHLELEVFIHGGMCTSYSGRCMLSNYMTNRDANRGGCAHSCRWNYDIYKDGNKLNTDEFFNIGSKDLNATYYIKDLLDIGVDSLKIEGRMKSLYYIAVVVGGYRKLIDKYYENNDLSIEDIKYFESEILKAENRETGCGFYKGKVTCNEQLYSDSTEIPTKDFLGIVQAYDEETNILTLEQRNYFEKGYVVEFFGPNHDNYTFEIDKVYDEEMNELDACRHPLQIIKFEVPFKLDKYDMMRKK